jgi:pimeloyl-ACP methyl ester carboxylesterase
MPFIETVDHTSLYYKDWGAGKPVVFVSSIWLGSAMWEYQITPLSNQGLRCIAFDRRGHGRSDDPGKGYDFDTLADDLAAVIEHLDLHEVTLVGHSVGCAEIAHYLARHGTSRVARAVLISTTTPGRPDTATIPASFIDPTIKGLSTDRPRFFADGAIKFFGLGSQWPHFSDVSHEMVRWAVGLTLQASSKASIEIWRSAIRTNFRSDLAAFTIPTLLIHGDHDLTAPLDYCGRPTAAAILDSKLIVYEGAAHGVFITEKDRLNHDILAHINGESTMQGKAVSMSLG